MKVLTTGRRMEIHRRRWERSLETVESWNSSAFVSEHLHGSVERFGPLKVLFLAAYMSQKIRNGGIIIKSERPTQKIVAYSK